MQGGVCSGLSEAAAATEWGIKNKSQIVVTVTYTSEGRGNVLMSSQMYACVSTTFGAFTSLNI